MHAIASHRRVVVFLAACLAAGWVTAPTAATSPRQTAAAITPPAPVIPPGVPSSTRPDFRPAGFTPGTYDQQLLEFDDATLADFVAHGLRDEVFEDCHRKLAAASDDECQKIYEATARVSPKFVDTRRRLLRGEIDAATFQALWHEHFLEREIALEQFLSWDDQLKLDGVPAGNDMFMTLSRWGMDVPDGFKLGLEEPPENTATDQPEKEK